MDILGLVKYIFLLINYVFIKYLRNADLGHGHAVIDEAKKKSALWLGWLIISHFRVSCFCCVFFLSTISVQSGATQL